MVKCSKVEKKDTLILGLVLVYFFLLLLSIELPKGLVLSFAVVYGFILMIFLSGSRLVLNNNLAFAFFVLVEANQLFLVLKTHLAPMWAHIQLLLGLMFATISYLRSRASEVVSVESVFVRNVINLVMLYIIRLALEYGGVL